MVVVTNVGILTYEERIDQLRETKLAQTAEKQELIGSMDHDDWALILPPPDRRKIVKAMSTSGMPITDCLLEGYEPKSNHPSGGFFGPKAVGENFGALLEAHPVYIDPVSSLAGGYMVNFSSYRKPGWNPDLDVATMRPDLAEARQTYQLQPGIGASQHFCQDLKIGLDLGWGGLLEQIRTYREANAPRSADFYDGLEAIVLGMQDWIQRTADAAYEMAETEENPQLRQNLLEIAEMNARLGYRAAPDLP